MKRRRGGVVERVHGRFEQACVGVARRVVLESRLRVRGGLDIVAVLLDQARFLRQHVALGVVGEETDLAVPRADPCFLAESVVGEFFVGIVRVVGTLDDIAVGIVVENDLAIILVGTTWPLPVVLLSRRHIRIGTEDQIVQIGRLVVDTVVIA